MELEELQYRGEKAKQILKDPLFKESLEACKQQILSAWEESPARDIEAREWLWKLYQASLRFEEIFKGYMDSGRIAEAQLKQKQSLGDRLRSVM